jgi:hypothetical protein
MYRRRRRKQAVPLDERLAEMAQQLRDEAAALPPSKQREEIERKLRQAEIAQISHSGFRHRDCSHLNFSWNLLKSKTSEVASTWRDCPTKSPLWMAPALQEIN